MSALMATWSFGQLKVSQNSWVGLLERPFPYEAEVPSEQCGGHNLESPRKVLSRAGWPLGLFVGDCLGFVD